MREPRERRNGAPACASASWNNRPRWNAPIDTPVGALVQDGVLYALTRPDSGKVKRIRNNPQGHGPPLRDERRRTIRGAQRRGPRRPVGRARTEHVEQLMARRFLAYRLLRLADRLLRRDRHLVAIAVTAP